MHSYFLCVCICSCYWNEVCPGKLNLLETNLENMHILLLTNLCFFKKKNKTFFLSLDALIHILFLRLKPMKN